MNRELYVATENLVGQNVLVGVSALVYDLNKLEPEECWELWNAPISDDDWIDAATDDGVTFIHDTSSGDDADWHWSWEDAEDDYDTEAEAAQAYCEEVGIEPDRREIYEHWIVTGWLANKLEAQDELIVRDWHGLTIWGRSTTGQMIAMDGVIQGIAKSVGG